MQGQAQSWGEFRELITDWSEPLPVSDDDVLCPHRKQSHWKNPSFISNLLATKPSLDLDMHQNVRDKLYAASNIFGMQDRPWNLGLIEGLTRFLSLSQFNSCIISYDRLSPVLICPDNLSSDLMWRVAVTELASDIETQRQDFNVLRISWQSKREG